MCHFNCSNKKKHLQTVNSKVADMNAQKLGLMRCVIPETSQALLHVV